MPEPEVGVPGAIVEAEATDLATPTDDLLVRLELLPKEGEQDVDRSAARRTAFESSPRAR